MNESAKNSNDPKCALFPLLKWFENVHIPSDIDYFIYKNNKLRRAIVCGVRNYVLKISPKLIVLFPFAVSTICLVQHVLTNYIGNERNIIQNERFHSNQFDN